MKVVLIYLPVSGEIEIGDYVFDHDTSFPILYSEEVALRLKDDILNHPELYHKTMKFYIVYDFSEYTKIYEKIVKNSSVNYFSLYEKIQEHFKEFNFWIVGEPNSKVEFLYHGQEVEIDKSMIIKGNNGFHIYWQVRCECCKNFVN